ncbi:baseplate J/gp47 family protein [Chryseobacterium caseinilyticum]|uniref:Baseplate J/gp47 family protein n=1 Tax=Chryseobacterium caseinilyticum TaxID=2771428 RepID=A0ABR8ZBL8_9FLAO|nr:baseplate J/gp47 family protein [Chryseobacterium caseinilyticum]MBD8082300.1 baseplate J/gp47 family protein [Chryseobacterium caseinilyticum]
MENCSSSILIHQGNGTTHGERLNPVLLPDFFLIDERTAEDYILFVQKLSEYVKFYDENNIEEGNWTAFFENESTSVIISVAKWNIEVLQNDYRKAEKEIYLSTNPANQLQILKDYFIVFTENLIKISKKMNGLDNEISIKENLIGSLLIIVNQLQNLTNEINIKSAEPHFEIENYLKNPFYTRKLQQFFGLLSSWKKYAESAVENQLNHYDSHHPHYALFLSFLKLMDVAKDKLNEFTKKHLDFYYKDVIRTENQNAKPDSVYLTVEAQKNQKFLLPKNTIFPAGKNTLGEKKYYASINDQVLNQIKLNQFSSYYLEDEKFYRSENLIKINGAGKSFDAFRTDCEEFIQGILIASPLLFLQSGERTVFLRFNKQNFKHDDFNFYITGEKKIIQLNDLYTEKKSTNTTETFIKIVISDTENSIVPFDQKIHQDLKVSTIFPVLKIVPKNKNIITSVSEIDLEVSVEKFTSFDIDSDFGSISSKKPFYPFSEFPKNGNGMTISSNEFFMKKNAVAQFIAETDKDSNAFVWLNDKVIIFQQDDSGRENHSDSFSATTNHFEAKEYNFKEIGGSEKLRIELNHSDYSAEKYMQDYVLASKTVAAGATAVLPYKPRIKNLTFNYSAKEIIDLKTNSASSTEIFITQPFGYRKIVDEVLKFTKLVNLEGFIYLGFENAVPKDSLSFLIQLEEGTANPQLPPSKINWEFLSENKWEKFNENSLADETYTLSQSGIIAITVPEFNPKNTVLIEGLFWIRISVSDIRAVCRILGVHHQVFKAVLIDFENKGTVFTEITPKETISKSSKVINGIKKINQPYSSFGGRLKEEDKTLYTRTSERLRHKNRAVTSWDYEHILLQQFPEIYRVKTLNHYRYDSELSNVSAGFVTIIPVAKSSATENINWKPLLSINKMQQIKEFLTKISSPHAKIIVKPPRAERVELNFKVKFHKNPGTDSTVYKKELMKTINEFLSPWAFELENADFAQNIEFSSLIKLIDNQYYVDYITDFSVVQFILDEDYEVKGNPVKNLNKVIPQTDFSLFIPTETHQIQEI